MKKILFTLLTILFFIPNVNAVTANGWAFKVEQYDDVNFRSCTSSSCNTTLSVTPQQYNKQYITATGEMPDFDFGYYTSSADLNTNGYGNMVMSFNRYKSGYLYQYTSYLCSSSSSWNISDQNTQVELYVGGYNDTINKVGNLTYHNVLVQTLDTEPFGLNIIDSTVNKCYAITNLFVPSVDAQNLGLLIKANSVSNQTLTIIGQDWNYLGLYSGTIEDSIDKIVNNSDLASASSVEEVQNSVNEVRQEVSNIDNSLNNTDTSGSQNQANSFFEGFESSDYGLSDIITMPLNLIKGLTSNSCVALSLTIPFVNKTFELPCMSSIYQQYFGSFYSLYQTITFGFISYWVIVKIFALVKGFKDPDDDKIEVVDL